MLPKLAPRWKLVAVAGGLGFSLTGCSSLDGAGLMALPDSQCAEPLGASMCLTATERRQTKTALEFSHGVRPMMIDNPAKAADTPQVTLGYGAVISFSIP
ncbi:MAG: hypothetical protein KGQ41_02325 [Alphaproteobacteria bacterium]|nr:hypothetical protein [Alphaproteobacteria bacterium]